MESFRPRSVRTAIGAGAVGVVGLLAWWWPGITGQDAQTDVVIVSSPSILRARDAIERRLREEGFTTAWESATDDTCSLMPVEDLDFEVLVVPLPDTNECSPATVRGTILGLVDVVDASKILAVLPWVTGAQESEILRLLTDNGIEFVDPQPLIGRIGETQACLWWDECPAEGRVSTIDDDGLTPAGQQRVARVIVAGVM